MDRFERFDNEKNLLPNLYDYCKNHCKEINTLLDHFPFLNYKNKDFIQLIDLFENVVKQDYDNNSLIIGIGESPSKMLDIQSKLKIWGEKNCDMFYLPISKTVLHFEDLSQFYSSISKNFYQSIIQQSMDEMYVSHYMSFLKNRGLYDEFYDCLKKYDRIIFVDFLFYGNSFVAFFLYLFQPLVKKIMDKKFEYKTIFFIDSENTDHQIAYSLSYLLKEFQLFHKIYYCQDYFTDKNAKKISSFFMDNPIRSIQEVKAPKYRFPSKLPNRKEYQSLMYVIYMMIFMNSRLYKKFVF